MKSSRSSRSSRLVVGIALALAGVHSFTGAALAGGSAGTPVEGRTEAPGWQPEVDPLPAEVPKDTPGLRYVTFSGSRFQPTASALTYSASGGAVYATAIPGGGFSFSLDFDLPVGAILREAIFYVVDNDASDMSLSVRTYDPATDVFTQVVGGSSSGASGSLQVVTLVVSPGLEFSPTNTSYRVRVAPGVGSTAHLLRGVRIGYLPPVVFANGFEAMSMPMSTAGKAARGRAGGTVGAASG